MKYRLGLKPVIAQPRVKLARYLTSDLPSVGSLKYPLGQPDLIQPQMFLNDQLGDCAVAGSIEEIRLVNALQGVTVPFTDAEAILNYEAVGGYVPGDPSTDNGTDVHDLYQYRQSTGFVDANGNRHKIIAYAGLTPGDWDELLVALSLFQVVGIGIQVPDYAEHQFDSGQPWHLQHGLLHIEGGHYIPIVGAKDNTEADLFTWGAKGGITKQFYEKLSNVAVVALTEEMFGQKQLPIDFAALQHDLPQLNTGPVNARWEAA